MIFNDISSYDDKKSLSVSSSFCNYYINELTGLEESKITITSYIDESSTSQESTVSITSSSDSSTFYNQYIDESTISQHSTISSPVSTSSTPTKSLIYTRSEEISMDGNRYSLTRQWNESLSHLLYIMLNPSSAT